MFKKGEIFKMKEADFQKNILIPLFRKMGFRDVTPFGGGTLERGKDIVMWKESELGQRLNYGVVVKAKKITGNAETSAGAMNVLNQVRQMLKTSYLNPVNGQTESIQRCFVACSKDITKEAMASIEGELENDLDKLVEWIHPGTNLFTLIDKFLPEQTIFETLATTQTQLDDLMKSVPYRIVGDTENKFTLKTKHEKATDEVPFTIGGNFRFDSKTDEGKEALAKFQEHIKTGTAIEIDGKHIESINFPDFLPDFLKPKVGSDAKIILKPVPGQHRLPLGISATSSKGDEARIEFVDLVSVQQGTEQIIFSNEHQAVPWQVVVTMELESKLVKFDFKFDFQKPNLTLKQELDCHRLARCMQHGANIELRHLDFGVNLFEGDLPPYPNLNVSDDWISLLELLILIQEKTKKVFFKKNKFSISRDEAETISSVAQIVSSGRRIVPGDGLDLNLSVDQTKSVLKSFGASQRTTLTFKPRELEKVFIWDTEIDLGEFIIFQTVFLDDNEIQKLEARVAHAADANELIPVHFEYEKERPYSELIYIDWVPESERKELLETPMFSRASAGRM